MPSLKDLKNRIESVKSTRKITKAMQMVAAAKLRRAQEAAEAARPYAERFNAVMAGLAASVAAVDSAPKLLPAPAAINPSPGGDDRPNAAFAAGFNSNIAKLARQSGMRRAAGGRRQDGQNPDRRQERPRQLKRDFGDAVRRPCRSERGQADRLCQCAGHRQGRCSAALMRASSTWPRSSTRKFVRTW